MSFIYIWIERHNFTVDIKMGWRIAVIVIQISCTNITGDFPAITNLQSFRLGIFMDDCFISMVIVSDIRF